MEPSPETTVRARDGRFVKGQSGNPAGKRAGTRNRATIWREALGETGDVTLAKILVEQVKRGDMVTARFIARDMAPPARARTVVLDVPDDATPQQILDAALRDMAAGRITPDEALTIGRAVELRLRLGDQPAEDRAAADAPRADAADAPDAPDAIVPDEIAPTDAPIPDRRPTGSARRPRGAARIGPLTARIPGAPDPSPTLHSPCIGWHNPLIIDDPAIVPRGT